MVNIEVYNFLDGKNLCNIFASLLVDEIGNGIPNINTELSVINVRNFFIVRGFTSSENVINCAKVFQDYVKEFDDEMSITIKVIDLIQYNTTIESQYLDLSLQRNKKDEYESLRIQKILNSNAKKGTYFNLKINGNNIFYDCPLNQEELVREIIETEFVSKNIIKGDFSNEVYTSDTFFGLSNNPKKYYLILLEYIKNHLFKKSISSEIDLNLFISDIQKSDNENCVLNITNGKHIVNVSWLESLILDVFPFELELLKKSFDLNVINYPEKIELGYEELPWEKLDLINELILL